MKRRKTRRPIQSGGFLSSQCRRALRKNPQSLKSKACKLFKPNFSRKYLQDLASKIKLEDEEARRPDEDWDPLIQAEASPADRTELTGDKKPDKGRWMSKAMNNFMKRWDDDHKLSDSETHDPIKVSEYLRKRNEMALDGKERFEQDYQNEQYTNDYNVGRWSQNHKSLYGGLKRVSRKTRTKVKTNSRRKTKQSRNHRR